MVAAPPVARPLEPQAAVALGLSVASFLLCPVVLAVAALVVAGRAAGRIDQGEGGGRELVHAAVIVAKVNLVLSAVIVLIVLAVAALRDDGDQARLGEAVGALDVLAIREGDCFDDPEGTEVTAVEAVRCEQPHDNEVYLVEDRTEGADAIYPGEAVLQSDSDELCLDAFELFVGQPKSASDLSFLSLYPTAGSWSAGDRAQVCAIYDPAGPVTGTLRGSG